MKYCITKIRFVRLSVRPFARSPLDTTKEYQFRKWNGMWKRDPTKNVCIFFVLFKWFFFPLSRVNGKFSIRYAQQILDDPNEISLFFFVVGLNILCDVISFFVHRTIHMNGFVSSCCQIKAKMQSFRQRISISLFKSSLAIWLLANCFVQRVRLMLKTCFVTLNITLRFNLRLIFSLSCQCVCVCVHCVGRFLVIVKSCQEIRKGSIFTKQIGLRIRMTLNLYIQIGCGVCVQLWKCTVIT